MILHVISVLYMFGELENQNTILYEFPYLRSMFSGFILNLFPYSPVCCILAHGFLPKESSPLHNVYMYFPNLNIEESNYTTIRRSEQQH